MEPTLDELLARLRGAGGPAEIFGALYGERGAALRRAYRALARAAHPDQHPGRAADAHAAFTLLQRWRAAAEQQLADGSYGAAPRISATSGGRRYVGYAAPLAGDLCELFPAQAGAGPLLLKAARRASNNDLLAAEARALRQLDCELAGQPVRAHFPCLEESFLLADAAGSRRQVNVLRREAGAVSLAEVLRAYPQGLALADAAWMFNRLLAALASAHSLGLVHGAVLPEHLLVRPDDHNGLLIDWCYSVRPGEPLRAISRPYADDYPPEALARQPVGPASDLYMAARLLLRLLGGRGATPPPGLPPPLAALLRACLIPAPQRRHDDAWQLLDDFRQILGELYGPPAFRPFHMPAV